eukprot:5506017-Karenia_brevis.AAC.1
MKGALNLGEKVRESSTILKLLTRCVKTLQIWGIEKRCQDVDKDLHVFTQAEFQMKNALLLGALVILEGRLHIIDCV